MTGRDQAAWADTAAAVDLALRAFVRGDAAPFRRLWTSSQDAVIMGGFGGYEVGGATVQDRLEWAARQYGDGELEVRELATFLGTDLACTVTLERSSGVGGDPARTMDLRVTQVFRLEDGEWRLVHRHADPLRPTATP